MLFWLGFAHPSRRFAIVRSFLPGATPGTPGGLELFPDSNPPSSKAFSSSGPVGTPQSAGVSLRRHGSMTIQPGDPFSRGRGESFSLAEDGFEPEGGNPTKM